MFNQETTATIILDDGPYAGAEFSVAMAIPTRDYFGVLQWLSESGRAGKAGDIDGLRGAARELGGIFAEYLDSWNITDRHGPIPATAEGIAERLDFRLLLALVGAWMQGIGKAALPLSGASTDGTEPPARQNGSSLSSIVPASTGGYPPQSLTGRTSDDSSSSSG